MKSKKTKMNARSAEPLVLIRACNLIEKCVDAAKRGEKLEELKIDAVFNKSVGASYYAYISDEELSEYSDGSLLSEDEFLSLLETVKYLYK